MKNLKLYNIRLASFFLLATILVGCEKDYFDTQPDNIVTTEEIFENRGQTERWWGGLFSNIPDIWDQPYSYQFGILTDEMDASNWTNPGLNSGAINADNSA
ncbi:hypothetical protein LZ575_14885 [Antarcticibacterium sp. 1MA-6-2]|uniref:hypothetical protein n=1 Tax=Antarcticibacterium sp. 1MA-6-2 TaxID=2908210 RepID=UPI001F3BEABD|nr:hypothetical protein [Antarcticibacterium sp. 1MA-6-2]UJH90182.1 hypothetical protein LZ575_14885 [Antarcticibacterium sp. 1MA-6-2]